MNSVRNRGTQKETKMIKNQLMRERETDRQIDRKTDRQIDR